MCRVYRCAHGHKLPNELLVCVVRARGLRRMERGVLRGNASSDPLVALRWRAAGGESMATCKTRVVKGLAPVWRETFAFELRHSELREDGAAPALEVRCEDRSRFSGTDTLGSFELSLAAPKARVFAIIGVHLGQCIIAHAGGRHATG